MPGKSPEKPNLSMRQWTEGSGWEPVVRVGIVLDEDAVDSIEITVPRREFAVEDGTGTRRNCPAGKVRAACLDDNKQVQLQLPGGDGRQSTVWRIEPAKEPTLARGAGICVHGVVAGRGFHWRKRIDQTLCGAVEIRRGRRGLVVINELCLEAYLAGVITSEMGGACPEHLLKAQCVVARSWLLAMAEAKHDADPFDRCNDDCCQRYQGTGDLSEAALAAARETRGVVLIDSARRVVDANYSKSCGGISETPETVWGITKPGLTSVCDAPPESPVRPFFPVTEANLAEYLDGDWWRGAEIYCSPDVAPEETFGKYLGRVDESGSYFRWDVAYTREELENLLRQGMPELVAMATLIDLRVTQRGPSGRAAEVTVEWATESGERHTALISREYRIREVLHAKFLYSSAFAVRIARDASGLPETIALRGAGWGHGAGLCQIGALGMALCGKGYEDICLHYFPTAQLKRIYT